MTIALWINRVLLTLLSFSTAGVKLAGMEEEMQLFRGIGFSDPMTMAFGGLQLAGAALLVVPRTTRAGAALMAITFLFATAVLLFDGRWVFGVVSLLFPASALFHMRRWPPVQPS